MDSASKNPAINTRSNWVILPRPIFEQLHLSATSVDTFARNILHESNNHTGGGDFIILADGKIFEKSLCVSFTTNTSIDWSLHTAARSHVLIRELSGAPKTRIQLIVELLLERLSKYLKRQISKHTRKFITVPLARFEAERTEQRLASGTDALTDVEEDVLLKFLSAIHEDLRNSNENTLKRFVSGAYGARMKHSRELENFNRLSENKKTQARALVSLLLNPVPLPPSKPTEPTTGK